MFRPGSIKKVKAWARPFLLALPVLPIVFLLPQGCSRGRDLGHQHPDSNVILISLDTLRADHLGCYGYPRDTSPAIDAFAEDSVLFKLAVSQAPDTLPSHVSVFTSLIPSHHRIFHTLKISISEDADTMASLLKERGYRTISFNNGGMVSAVYGMDHGFDLYHSFKGFDHVMESKFVTIVDAAEKWLDGRGEEKFFLFLHTYEPHYPYIPELKYMEPFRKEYHGLLETKELPVTAQELHDILVKQRKQYPGIENHHILRTKDMECVRIELLRLINHSSLPVNEDDLQHIIDTYDAEILSLDDAFADLMQYLKEKGIYEEAMIIVISDHGEEFNEHGMIGRHSHTLFDELLNTVLIIKFPYMDFAGTVVEQQVRNIDILPTLLDVLGKPPMDHFQGVSLIDLIRGVGGEELPAVGQRLLVEDMTFSNAIRTRKWKLYDSKLFDLENDPSELKDVSSEYPEVMKILSQKLDEILASSETQISGRTIELDEETKEQLEALGY
jgi:arylsulfatase A-like enzyme